MTEETESLVLEILKKIQYDMANIKDELKANRIWMASVDGQLAAVHLDLVQVNSRIDILSRRIDRVETRLGLADA